MELGHRHPQGERATGELGSATKITIEACGWRAHPGLIHPGASAGWPRVVGGAGQAIW